MVDVSALSPRIKFYDEDGYKMIPIWMVNIIHCSTYAEDLNDLGDSASICVKGSSFEDDLLRYDHNSLGYRQETYYGSDDDELVPKSKLEKM